MPSIFYVGGSVNSLTNTFNIPTSAKSGSVDMGEDHEYRYVNGESLYLQGKADGAAEAEFSFNGNATSADVLQNKTFYGNNQTLQTGTIPTRTPSTNSLAINESRTYNAGYYPSNWTIKNSVTKDAGVLKYGAPKFGETDEYSIKGYVDTVMIRSYFENTLSSYTDECWTVGNTVRDFNGNWHSVNLSVTIDTPQLLDNFGGTKVHPAYAVLLQYYKTGGFVNYTTEGWTFKLSSSSSSVLSHFKVTIISYSDITGGDTWTCRLTPRDVNWTNSSYETYNKLWVII